MGVVQKVRDSGGNGSWLGRGQFGRKLFRIESGSQKTVPVVLVEVKVREGRGSLVDSEWLVRKWVVRKTVRWQWTVMVIKCHQILEYLIHDL